MKNDLESNKFRSKSWMSLFIVNKSWIDLSVPTYETMQTVTAIVQSKPEILSMIEGQEYLTTDLRRDDIDLEERAWDLALMNRGQSQIAKATANEMIATTITPEWIREDLRAKRNLDYVLTAIDVGSFAAPLVKPGILLARGGIAASMQGAKLTGAATYDLSKAWLARGRNLAGNVGQSAAKIYENLLTGYAKFADAVRSGFGRVFSGASNGVNKIPKDLSGSFNINKSSDGIKLQFGDPVYWEKVGASHGMVGFVDKKGILGFDVFSNPELRLLHGTGTEMFDGMMKRIAIEGIELKGLRGAWISGTDSVNFEQFSKGVASGLTPEQAALNTWTGKLAQKHGYTRIDSLFNNGKNVYVTFVKRN